MKICLLTIMLLLAALTWSCSRSQKPQASVREAGHTEGATANDESGGKEKGVHKENEKPGDSETTSSVEMPFAMQKRLGVLVEPVASRPLAETLQLNGTVQAIENRVAHIRPLARGRLTEVLAKVGDRVHANQVLARFDNIEAGEVLSQYETARAEVGRLKAQQAAATRQLERSRRLVDIGAVSQRELEASQAEQQGLEEAIRAQQSTIDGLAARLHRFGVDERQPLASSVTSIRAPFSGLVLKVASSPGEVVDSTMDLFSVANLSSVYVQTQVYEKDLGRVRVGQPAVISVSAYPNERFPGRIVSLGGMIDPQTRTAPVRCEVDNSRGRLFVDMFATVELPTEESRITLAVSSDAIQQVDGKNAVFVQTAPDRFSVQPVQIGQQTASLVEITAGLKAGQKVVSKGAFQVKSALQAGALGEEEGEKK